LGKNEFNKCYNIFRSKLIAENLVEEEFWSLSQMHCLKWLKYNNFMEYYLDIYILFGYNNYIEFFF
jgi:hypothetical protein